MKTINIDKLSSYKVDPRRGFLPAQDPLEQLPPYFDAWEHVAAELSVLLLTGRLRPILEQWTPLDINRLKDERQLQRAMLILCYIGNAYVWGGNQPATVLPRGIALPWAQIAEKLGRPPISSHASLALYNWRRLDKEGPLDLDNLDTLQLFGGGIDEKWFYLTAVVIEAKGAPSLQALVEAQNAVVGNQVDNLAQNLKTIAATLTDIYTITSRIPEKCDPYIFTIVSGPMWPVGKRPASSTRASAKRRVSSPGAAPPKAP